MRIALGSVVRGVPSRQGRATARPIAFGQSPPALQSRHLRLRSRPAVLGAGLLAPLVVCLAVRPFRDDIANTNAALLLVLVIVAVAISGNRLAGVLSAASAAASFDFFLTRPYERFAINDRADVETGVLLLAVGIGVTELAGWGYRQRAIAVRESGYLAGLQASTAMIAAGSSNGLVEAVSDQLTSLLGLTACRFQYGVAGLGKPARLQPDGRIEWNGRPWDVERRGLPDEVDIEILVEHRGRLHGRFLVHAAAGSRPSMAQRRFCVTLAGQVGTALS